jgi:hypothetical protein
LSGTIPVFETFMTNWEEIAEKHPRLKRFIEPGLEWATRYYNRMDGTKAYIVAMCKYIYLSNWVTLLTICSSEPRNSHELD